MGNLFAGTTALVTGAANGIGRSIARQFAERDAELVVVDVDAGALDVAATELARITTVHARVVDMGDMVAVRTLHRGLVADGINVDVLVNNAGINGGARLLEIDEEEWDRVLSVNLKGPWLLAQLVGRDMIARGSAGKIVNLSSAQAFRTVGARGAYSVSKAGLSALTRALAAELGPHGINVNAVAPAATDTPMVRKALRGQDMQVVPHGNLLGRMNEPEDVAAMVMFLCSPDSRQVTAQTLHVNGGAFA